jgi:hypothetical protein
VSVEYEKEGNFLPTFSSLFSSFVDDEKVELEKRASE